MRLLQKAQQLQEQNAHKTDIARHQVLLTARFPVALTGDAGRNPDLDKLRKGPYLNMQVAPLLTQKTWMLLVLTDMRSEAYFCLCIDARLPHTS